MSTVLIARKRRNACSQLTAVLLLCVRWEGETKTWQCKRSSAGGREPTVGWIETYRFFRVDHRQSAISIRRLLNRCIRLVSTGALLTLVKKVIRLTRHNQAVDFFFFGGVYWRYNCQGNLRMSRYNCQGNLGMLSISYCAIYFHFLDQIQGINIVGRFSSPSLHKPFGFTFTIFIKTICLNQINFAVSESRNWNAVSKLLV